VAIRRPAIRDDTTQGEPSADVKAVRLLMLAAAPTVGVVGETDGEVEERLRKAAVAYDTRGCACILYRVDRLPEISIWVAPNSLNPTRALADVFIEACRDAMRLWPDAADWKLAGYPPAGLADGGRAACRRWLTFIPGATVQLREPGLYEVVGTVRGIVDGTLTTVRAR